MRLYYSAKELLSSCTMDVRIRRIKNGYLVSSYHYEEDFDETEVYAEDVESALGAVKDIFSDGSFPS